MGRPKPHRDEHHDKRKRVRLRSPPCHQVHPRTLFILAALLAAGAPLVLMRVVHAFVRIPGIDLEPDLDYVELFSGQRALLNAMRDRGLRGASFDYDDDPYYQNFNGNVGFVHALHLTLKLARGGGLHAGSP